MMRTIWKQFGGHLDILLMAVTSLCLGSMAWANLNSAVSGHADRISRLEAVQQKQDTDVADIKTTAARTEQKVDDMSANVNDIKIWLRTSDK